MAPNRDQSSQTRTCIAVIQGLCGLMAIACGIALIPLKPDERYAGYLVARSSRIIANGGFGIWGGVIIAFTAVMGCVYKDKKAMISIYAAFSLVSMTVAVILFFVAITGVARFARLDTSSCDNFNVYNYDRPVRCCFDHYLCDYSYSYHGGFHDYPPSYRMADPFNNYYSDQCRREREAEEEQCREALRKTKPANMSVSAILLIVSVVEFIVSITAAVLSFIVACRGCCNSPAQQVVHLTYPPNGLPGSVPTVVVSSMVPGSTPLQVTRVAPNTTALPYPPAMAVINPNVVPGSYPLSQGFGPGMPIGTNNAMAAGANQWQVAPPPQYTVAGNI